MTAQEAALANENRAAKAALRRTCHALAAALPASYTARASTALCAALTALPAYKAAGVVFCFVGAVREIDTVKILQTVLNDNKILCVPFCAPQKQGVMAAKQVTDLSQLQMGAYGIAAPPEHARTIAPGKIALAILPCLAADRDGNRLGYGGGYYDRYLPQLAETCTTVLLCRSRMVQPRGTIPTEPHDVCAQILLTEEGVG